MNFGNKNKDKKHNVDIDNTENRSNEDIEVVIGDDSDLEISDVGDYMKNLKPKVRENKQKKVVIPPVNNKKKKDK